MAQEYKRRHGDRRDGRLVRELDAMHFVVPCIYPNRCDNEAYLSQRIDLAPINAWLEKKNAAIAGNEEEIPYTLFHVLVTAFIKTITLRPKMNRFIANKNVYQRHSVSAAFVVKKKFTDDGAEALAIIRAKPEDTADTIHAAIREQVTSCRGDGLDRSSDSMEVLNKMPRFLAKFLIWIITKLDKHGLCPDFLIGSDPYYASVLLSNLGSLGLKSGYHHLVNWGTNSVFCIVGVKGTTPHFDPEGNLTMKQTVDLGLTIDERIADGYYYAKTMELLRRLFAEPELLERPMNEEVDL